LGSVFRTFWIVRTISSDSATITSTSEEKEHQIQEKDNQIAELHQLLAIAQKNINSLTEQNQLVLEDMRHRQPLWQRFKAKLGFRQVGAVG
jgi:hypothetical protein